MYTRILHPTDLSDNHYDLCEKASQIAKHHQAELYLLHVIEVPSTFILAQNLGFMELIKPHQEDAILVLQTLGKALHIPLKHQFVEIGCVQSKILEKTQQLQCDLIIIGKPTHTTLFSRTAYHVMQEAPCDTLTLS